MNLQNSMATLKLQPATYSNAEVRGRIRMWKTALAMRYQTFNTVFQQSTEPATDFARRSSLKGRMRALAKLRQAFEPWARIEAVNADKKQPLAVWSILHARESVVSACDDPGKLQDCVTVNYVIAGRIPAPEKAGTPRATGHLPYAPVCLAEGLWTLEVPDHALGRAIERSGLPYPGKIVWEAHDNLLSLPVDSALANKSFLVKAGAGAFVCELRVGEEASTNSYGVHVYAPTWLSDDQLHDDQVVLCAKSDTHSLAQSWLMPRPLCNIRIGDDHFIVQPLI